MKPEQGEAVMYVDRIPPFFVRFFPNTEGIKMGSIVNIVRDSKRKEFLVTNIELPEEFRAFIGDIENSKSLGELLGRYKADKAVPLMYNEQWFCQIAVAILDRNTDEIRLVHPSCLCLAPRK